MIDLPLFSLMSVDLELNSYLRDSNYFRAFEFGMATEKVQLPYVVWQVVSGTPYNNYSCAASADKVVIQIDVYGKTGKESSNIAKAIRRVITLHGYITDIRGTSRDVDGVYRTSFDTSWHII